MSTASRLAAFALGLAAVAGSAAALGNATEATPPFQSCLRVVTDTHGQDGPMTAMTRAGQAQSGASMAPMVQLGLRITHDLMRVHGSPAVRVGLHHGTAVEPDGDYFGAAVNLAARVSAVASGGRSC